MKKLLYILLGLIFTSSIIYPQNKALYVKDIKKDDGLPSNRINCILQDKDGFMWFGTGKGLCRFDGYSMKVFSNEPNNPYSISFNRVTSIVEEKETGNLWVGSNTMDYFDKITNKFTNMVPDSINVGTITTSLLDSRRNLWFGTEGDGLFCLDTLNTISIYRSGRNDTNSLHSSFIGAIYEDPNQNVWVGTAWAKNSIDIAYLHIFDRQQKHFKRISQSSEMKNIYTIFRSSNNDMWIGSFTNGLFRIKNSDFGSKIINYTKENGYLLNNCVQVIEEDEIGNLFIANRDGGLIYFDITKNKTTKYLPDIYNPNSITSKAIISMYKSSSGIIWMGTYNKGLNFIDNKRKQFEHYKINFKEDGLFNNNIRSVFQDSQGDIWVGTKEGGGLSQFHRDKGTFTHYKPDENNPGSLSDDYIFSINELDDRHLLIGTLNKGMDILDKQTGKFEHFSRTEGDNTSIANNKVYAITRCNDNKIWLATFILESFDPVNNIFQNFREIVEPKCFCIEDDDHIWIGTKSFGLYLFNTRSNKFEQFMSNEEDNTSINANNVTGIQKDREGNLWLSLNGGGISRMDIKKRTFESYTINEGLPTNLIYSLLIDEHDNIWFSSAEGLSRFNPSTLKIKNYDVNDGLQGNEFEMYVALKTKDGEMIFGGNNGFNIFHPDSIKDNTAPPPVVLTEFRLFNKPVSVNSDNSLLKTDITYCKDLTLKHWQNIISFRYSALNYTSSEKNRYAYILEGLEDDWNFVDNQRIASYSSLPAGKYVFRVKASNNDGIWNEKGTSIQITVLPPWWETWWFRAILIIVLATSILSFYFYRVNALKRQKKVLEQKVFERTAELREANSQLEEKQEEIMQQNEEIITVNNQLKTKNEEIESQKEEIEASRDQLEKAFNNITLLSEFGQKLTATFDFDAINKMIYEYVNSLMDTAAFGIGIYNEKRKVIDFPYFMEKGRPVPYFYKDLSSEKSLSVRCFINSKEIVINNLSVDYKKYLGELPDVQTSQLPSSVIHLPLTIENKPIGTLTVNSFKKNAYNENDIANLRTLASYISIALDNSKAYRIIRSKNEQISGSIRYGQTIQKAMLPSKQQLDDIFENFILFRPKDIVSGDFYWFASIKNTLNPEGLVGDKLGNPQGLKKDLYFLAVVDCTGHGVPGAFMSMIGSRLLSDIVIERKIYSPAKILEQLNTMIRKALRQDTTDNHDGMDVCLCRFQYVENEWELTYAGAKRSLLYYSSTTNRIEEIEGTRRSIGGVAARKNIISFSEKSLKVNFNDIYYLSTDGLIDQCNPKKRKFSSKRLIDLLQQINHLSLPEQKDRAEKELDAFQEGFEQRDDITLVGVKFKR